MTRFILFGAFVAALSLATGFASGLWWAGRNTLPPLTRVEVAGADLPFIARLDTGATVSSINAHDIEIIGGGDQPSRSDAGKMARFVLVNHDGEKRTVTAEIDQVRGVRTADCRELRYHVYLTIRFRGKAYRVLTNLNDRSRSDDKLLLGRNWLRYGFAVEAAAEPET